MVFFSHHAIWLNSISCYFKSHCVMQPLYVKIDQPFSTKKVILNLALNIVNLTLIIFFQSSSVNCYSEAEKHGASLLCAFNRRFDPTRVKVRKEVKAGRIGQLQMVKTTSRDNPLPSVDYLRISGGIFHDCAIHDIDVIMWIVGEFPTTVYAQAHAFRSTIAAIDDVDTVAITMKFPGGVIAQIDLSRFAAYGYDQRLEAFGSNSMLQSQNARASSVCVSDDKGLQDDVYMFPFWERYAESYKNELDHFLDVIEGKPCSVKREEVLMASKVASACQESYKTGKPVHIT